MSASLIVVGAGGHAKVVVGMLHALGVAVEAAFDDRAELWGKALLGVPIRGPISDLRGVRQKGVLGIGGNAARKKIGEGLTLDWQSFVHPRAWVDPSAVIGPGTVVFAGAMIQPEARIGAHVIVNTSASIDHDCVIGDFAHLCPGTHLAGNVTIGEGTMLGTGASAIPGVKVGAWSVVGAGGAVVRDLPSNVVAFGVPARTK